MAKKVKIIVADEDDFKDNEYYSADDINSIRSAFITAGVLGSESPAMKVSPTDSGVSVSAGTATITCASADGFSKQTVKVTVTQPPTGIKFNSKKEAIQILKYIKFSMCM